MITKRDESADTGRKLCEKKNLDLLIYSPPSFRHMNQEAINLNYSHSRYLPPSHFFFLLIS